MWTKALEKFIFEQQIYLLNLTQQKKKSQIIDNACLTDQLLCLTALYRKPFKKKNVPQTKSSNDWILKRKKSCIQ